jgi:hypothetical protein
MFLKTAAPALAIILAATSGWSQAADTSVDLNQYYRFPVSVGVEYQGLSALSALNVPYTIYDIAGTVTVPIPSLPVLQPFLRAGYTRFESLDTAFPGKWSHYHLYGLLGLGYDTRFAKNFAVGASAGVGVSEAVFPSAVDTGAVGTQYLLLELGGKVSLTPSYAFSIDFTPALRYQYSFGPLTTFNAFYLSLGLSASFRFGEDPDSARAVIRSLRFEQPDVPAAFSAMQSWYANNPIGHITLVNTEKQPLTDVEVSFSQKEYMDAPTPSWSAARIEPGASVVVPLKAVFNSRVYDISGGLGYVPLTGEVIATYKVGGRSAEQRSTLTYNLYEKRAMTWDDDRKAAAFITPLDSALKNYTAFISEAGKATVVPLWNQPLQIAMGVYDGLREIGIFYQDDPAAPFAKVQADRTFVDFITMPRDTLARRYGDCKNLTVLYCSLMGTRSVKTGFITVPGHIYPVIDTGVAAADYRDVNPDRTMTLAIDGTLWVPVEITMLDGKSDFMAAWKRGIDEWNAYEKERAFYRTADAQAVFSPVAVQQVDLGLQYGSAGDIAGYLAKDLDAAASSILAGYTAAAEASKDKKDYGKLGTIAAKLGRYKDAEDALGKALKIDPKYTSALINLANVAYLKKDYKKAIESYRAVLLLLGTPPKGSPVATVEVIAMVNLAHAYSALGSEDQSAAALAQATKIDPDKVASLAEAPPGAGGGGTRAANETGAAAGVSFVEGVDQ